MARTGTIAGLMAGVCYFGAAVIPLPDPIARLLGFAFGPLLAISFLGLYEYLSRRERSSMLLISCVFGIIAAVLVTTLIVVQVENQMWFEEGLVRSDTPAAENAERLVWRAVNRVQALMDVAWDIFLSLSVFLFGLVMVRHPRFSGSLGWIGMALSLGLLTLNLYTFPAGPAYAGSVDLGPALGVWFLAVFARLGMLEWRKQESP